MTTQRPLSDDTHSIFQVSAMTAGQAIGRLDAASWALASIRERLDLLYAVRLNLKALGEELAACDARMKNELMGETIFGVAESKVATIVPVANTISAAIDLYETLDRSGGMPLPVKMDELSAGKSRVEVFPRSAREKVIAGGQKGYVYIDGEAKQVSPLDKPEGIVAVLGAGNYSSSLEMVKAIFFDNKAVVHKPHHLNARTDEIWAEIFAPLVQVEALSFCASDQGQALTKDARLSAIYFTGGAQTAKAIMAATDTQLVSECGGNNPCIIVPGDRPWTDKEIEHQAVQIATASKMNGGAVCGRPQTVVTCANWPQRSQFLGALRKAIAEDTPACGTYYPGSYEVWNGFAQAYPHAEVLEPENGRFEHGKYMLITGADEEGYATSHEAFCQIIDEVPLDVPADAGVFLPRAVAFCNDRLMGTLGACILIDEDTKEAHHATLDRAVQDLHYGGIAVNTMPPFIFLNPYLTWGGNEDRAGQRFVSGHGNFGNMLGFENIEKSVLEDTFMSLGHMMNTSRAKMEGLYNGMARYAVEPSWGSAAMLMVSAVAGSFKGKDF